MLEIRSGVVRRGRVPILEPVRFSVPASAVIGVAGINGSGKTSLFMQLTGTVRGAARSACSVLVGGRPATLAYVPQVPALPGWVRAEDLASAFGVDWRTLVASMPQLALHEIPAVHAGRLSPGQRQALMLAVMLGRRADLTLLDEPFSALDFRRRAGALDLLRQRAAAGQSLLLSSPTAADFAGLCTHMLVLHGGRCIFSGQVSDLAPSGAAAELERELLLLVR